MSLFSKKPKGWLFGNRGGKFNGNPESDFHAGNKPDKGELLTRRSRADEQIEADLYHRFGITATVRSFNDRTSYGVMIAVSDYTSAMAVQQAFSGEQVSISEVEGGGYCITLTE